MQRYILVGSRSYKTAESKTEAENLRSFLVATGESVRMFVYVQRHEALAGMGLFQEV
jgi:hypothetical protein